ncbi:MAG: FAD:protein FMN transferase, partial [Candidatus Marinimicrobia bacterium]|nr:FAD:protein FMN transferase [Candidatus Neomarinimicrobiota bacterium]
MAGQDGIVTPSWAARRIVGRVLLVGFTLIAGLTAWLLWPRAEPEMAEPVLQGRIMGTTYQVRLGRPLDVAEWSRQSQRIERQLEVLNRNLSVYIPVSAVSRVNAARAGEPVTVSAGCYRVLSAALEVARHTGGAFDPTVAPLVALWGFGPSRAVRPAPTAAQVAAGRARCGWALLRLDPPNRVVKEWDDVQLDLGGIAKGYGVDVIAELLAGFGHSDYLVEIGGEVRVAGRAPGGRPWRVGIQKPLWAPSGTLATVQGVLHLTEGAVATSGDYQQFYEDETGRRRTHIVDPRTGYPPEHDLAGVTVYAPTCQLADALATAFFVLGPTDGLAVLADWPGV